MVKRLLIFGLFVSGIQVLLYYLMLRFVQFVQSFFMTDKDRAFISDYGLIIGTTLFFFIVTIQNISTTLINKKWFTRTAFILATVFYFIGWGEDYFSWPVTTILFLFVGITVLTSKFIIDRILIKWETDRRTNA
jgi:hypothetical protein